MRNHILALLATVLLAGCAAADVPATDDPAVKLQQARQLFSVEGRPAQAERLIQEAMATYRESGDAQGLALAHREYAYFLSTPGTDAIIANPGGAQAPASPERLKRALGEMREASTLFAQLNIFDRLSNTAMGEARIEHDLDDTAAACASLTRSLAASDKQTALHPDRKPNLPPGMNSFADLIGHFRKEYGCPP
ncbi:hypothetical protein [Zavarzinia aquatilis]|uniref:Uncharacterized protein n=1 Tax=Zavarzinia aquatilis TaxID=2211142 RepID=A0A317EG39_9PROT|nr:hypothetical protein [Zavarzinia aquatilis]PWR25987.1 hypothetical protein DKG74_03300 [Zavarzinia aquatilis]